MEQVLKALADPRRRAILRLVRDEERSAGEIAAHFADVSRPAVSQHLSVLRQAGLVRERRAGNRRLYLLSPAPLADVARLVEEFWSDRLGALRRAAERAEGRDRRAQPGPSTNRPPA